MIGVSATDVAICKARENGTLTVEKRVCQRLGNEYWAISDEYGLIEVALSESEAESRAVLAA